MDRTSVLIPTVGPDSSLGPPGAARPEAGSADVAEPSVLDPLELASEALRSVSLEGLDEDGLCRVVAAAGQVKALANALTVRATSGLEALRAGSAREALVARAKLSGRAARRMARARSSESVRCRPLCSTASRPMIAWLARSSVATDSRCGWGARSGWPLSTSTWLWRYATGDACCAGPRCIGAGSTTSTSTSPIKARQTSRISRRSVTAATCGCIGPNGVSCARLMCTERSYGQRLRANPVPLVAG